VASEEKRCPQCWQKRPRQAFIGARGKPIQRCITCRRRYARPREEYLKDRPIRRGLRKEGAIRVAFTAYSKNRKLHGLPASITSAETCPPSCTFYGSGCYAEFAWTRVHWVRTATTGLSWKAFLEKVRSLPPESLWRHNEAGDLPGVGQHLAVDMLLELVLANLGRRGFTFSHKRPRSKSQISAFRKARASGFTINLSADNLAEADELAALDVGPVAVVLPTAMSSRGTYTPQGRKVVVCPNETVGLTCKECELCALPHRKAIVGFRAHGQMQRHVSELVQLRRPALRTEARS